MDCRINKNELSAQYKEHLKNNLLAFWNRAIDTEHGGVYTCFTNDGSRLISTDKYIWSQGRMAWIYSRLADDIRKGILDNFDEADAERYLALAEKTCSFITNNAILPQGEGVCAYLTDADGHKKESIKGKGYYTSYFVDCFVALGLAEYSRVSGDKKYLKTALELYDRMMSYLDKGVMVSEPYPVRAGYRTHAKDMILSCVTNSLWNAAKALSDGRRDELREKSLYHCRTILDTFYRPEYGVIQEMPPVDKKDEDTFLARHIMPGHALESMWLCLDILEQTGEKQDERIFDVARHSFEYGWDKQFGGMLRCSDIEGSVPPKGRVIGDAYEQLMLETWDSKLWWPHAEALYSSLRFYFTTGDVFFFDYYSKISAYIKKYFVNPDKKIGEWIQILDRRGRPMDKVVALPVKDPFHIMRDVINIIELLAPAAK